MSLWKTIIKPVDLIHCKQGERCEFIWASLLIADIKNNAHARPVANGTSHRGIWEPDLSPCNSNGHPRRSFDISRGHFFWKVCHDGYAECTTAITIWPNVPVEMGSPTQPARLQQTRHPLSFAFPAIQLPTVQFPRAATAFIGRGWEKAHVLTLPPAPALFICKLSELIICPNGPYITYCQSTICLPCML